MKRLTKGKHLSGQDGKVVEVAGRYEVEDTAPHKVMYEGPDGRLLSSTKVVNVVLEDDAWVQLWVRPSDEMSRLNGKAVVASGKLSLPKGTKSADQAAPLERPSLVDIQRIEAA